MEDLDFPAVEEQAVHCLEEQAEEEEEDFKIQTTSPLELQGVLLLLVMAVEEQVAQQTVAPEQQAHRVAVRVNAATVEVGAVVRTQGLVERAVQEELLEEQAVAEVLEHQPEEQAEPEDEEK